MPVADGAKCCSSGSKVYQIAMSTREDQKELSNEEPTSSGAGMSHSKEFQYKKATKLDRPKSKMAAAKVKDKSCKSQPFSTRKRRAPLVDAATAPTHRCGRRCGMYQERTTSGRCSEISK